MPFKDIEMRRSYDREHARMRRKMDPAGAVAAVLKSRDPAKHRARATLHYAKKTGKVEQSPCEICGEHKSEAHHDDYSKPLDVRWLCRLHHAEIHAREVAA